MWFHFAGRAGSPAGWLPPKGEGAALGRTRVRSVPGESRLPSAAMARDQGPLPGWVPPPTVPPDPRSGPPEWGNGSGAHRPQQPWAPPGPVRRHTTGALVGVGLGGVVVGFVVTFVLLAVVATLVDLGSPGTAVTTYNANASGRTDVLSAGTCLSARPSLIDVSALDQTVSCSEVHGSEVIGIVTLPDLIERPDAEALDEFVNGACGLHLRGFVGSSPDDTRLTFGGVVPDDDAWKEQGREVFCVVDSADFDGGIGSVENSGA